MFRIAKNIVKTFEQSVSDTIGVGGGLDSYFESIPSHLLVPGIHTNETLQGLRVLSCDETQLQLQSFFDFIVGINDQPLPLVQNQHGYLYPDFAALTRILNSACGSSVRVHVWSGRGGVFRTEYIRVERKQNVEEVPLDTPGDQEYREFASLGFTLQWTPLIAATYTYHVLEVSDATGPASVGGLVPREDYVVGCQEGLLATGGETLLQDILRSKANQDLALYVYNAVSECVRPVVVHIGSDGRLGCNMGYGYLHRIPPAVGQTVDLSPPDHPDTATAAAALGPQTVPEAVSPSRSFIPAGSPGTFVGASGTPPPPTSQFIVPPPVHKRKTKHASSTNAASASIQDYFQEGKDPSPPVSSKVKATPPPPPPSKNQDSDS
ncbi:LADA_0H00980g1_1 [Lachancea dasiensis]|uniref:LADA_0H00980g1_1 n=1 Tax=Lachancea dasiensis TaxID=1072105 RepID=A0A1G4JZ12_9SACH|nr:LADA_0H00980g1_1 [Lachancea dasiensis]